MISRVQSVHICGGEGLNEGGREREKEESEGFVAWLYLFLFYFGDGMTETISNKYIEI